MRATVAALALAVTTSFAFTPAAHAHIELLAPKARYPRIDIKFGPCGRTGGKRTTNVTTFKPGETIKVSWNEYIGHPGHYRISFDTDGVDDFVDPKGFMDFNTAPSVLVDNIADKSGMMTYTQDLKLPDVECGNCTLQVIQVMTDKPPFGDGNDIYYTCADLVLSKTGAPPDGGPAEPPSDAGGGAGGGGGTGGTGGGAQPDGGSGGNGGSGGSGASASGGCSYGSDAPMPPAVFVAAGAALLFRRRRPAIAG